jgi:hypothetical protein
MQPSAAVHVQTGTDLSDLGTSSPRDALVRTD